MGDLLTINDLQKGMRIKVQADDLRYHGMVLIVDYVNVSPDYMVRTSYAVAIDDTGTAHLLTNDSKLILYKEETSIGTSIVICSICGKQMDIKEWMQANLHSAWKNYDDSFIIPHMNRSHDCNACGHLWLSTDALVTVGNILIWEYVP